jgi:hypothetical protein
MISDTNALIVFNANLERTNLLIEAIVRIEKYNWIYQNGQKHPEMGRIIKLSQDALLAKIETSCSEHAVISLATAFETYLKELFQEVLVKHSDFFLTKETKYSMNLKILIEDTKEHDYESISSALGFERGFNHSYLRFFKAYGINVLTKEENKWIETIYLCRNCFVHNAGKLDKKTFAKLKQTYPSKDGKLWVGNYKQLRTQMKRLIPKISDSVEFQITGVKAKKR